MGLFDAFKKKQCDICGGDIGLLGNRKLEDGNMCKNCAKKLSPFFDDRRHSTIAQINEQLAYREQNRAALPDFHCTRVMGPGYNKIYLDEDAGTFMIASDASMASWEKEQEANPDIIRFDQVTGCRIDIDENHNEVTRTDKDGNKVSYNPPRYRYYYDFDVIINVRHPWFDEIKLRLNKSSVDIEYTEHAGSTARIGGLTIGLGGGSSFDPMNYADYRLHMEIAEEIKEVLLGARQQARDSAAAAAAPKQAVTCPYCGATTTPNASGQCEFCGGAVNG